MAPIAYQKSTELRSRLQSRTSTRICWWQCRGFFSSPLTAIIQWVRLIYVRLWVLWIKFHRFLLLMRRWDSTETATVGETCRFTSRWPLISFRFYSVQLRSTQVKHNGRAVAADRMGHGADNPPDQDRCTSFTVGNPAVRFRVRQNSQLPEKKKGQERKKKSGENAPEWQSPREREREITARIVWNK